MTDDSLLDVRDVAKTLRISVRQVWKLVKAGQIPPPVRLARSVRWQRKLFEKFIADGCRIERSVQS